MSNPCINRWGLNTFWHNFWYTDFDYAAGHKQDYAFSRLVTTFLFYGIGVSYNIFANTYWYSQAYSLLSQKTYYRWVTKRDIKYGEKKTFNLRLEADCVFPMKLWILKYSQWFIINQYWFHPLKKYRPLIGQEHPDHRDSVNVVKPLRNLKFSALRKAKVLFSKNFLRRILYSNYYRF